MVDNNQSMKKYEVLLLAKNIELAHLEDIYLGLLHNSKLTNNK